ncbi:hypothetical protein LCGC14_1784580 [marine sediment metagenome]|uniref:Uncharacterized protein n=1 Tax=marine sediment metagenome TaxID=412755 RepID=A0A0F9J9B0_9ZZZZ
MSVEYKGKIIKIKKQKGYLTLNLSRMNIENISDIMGLKDLINLQSLMLNDNNIKEITGLEFLRNLQSLSINNNNLTKIEGLEENTSLRSLSLQHNNIRIIEGLDTLIYLEKLYLNGNHIEIFGGLGNLSSLNRLDLRMNPVFGSLMRMFGVDRTGNFLQVQEMISHTKKSDNNDQSISNEILQGLSSKKYARPKEDTAKNCIVYCSICIVVNLIIFFMFFFLWI